MKNKRIIAVAVATALVLAGSFGVLASEKNAGGYSYLGENGEIDLLAYYTAEGATASLQNESMEWKKAWKCCGVHVMSHSFI